MSVTSYSFLQLGTALLDSAIRSYLAGDYLAALVLAGAAEDHLGGPYARPAEDWVIDPRAHKQDARDFNLVHRHMFGEDHPAPWNPVNEVKNRAKHYNKEPLTIDAEDEAYWSIDRAVKNYALCTGTYPERTAEIDNAHRIALEAKSRQPEDPGERG